MSSRTSIGPVLLAAIAVVLVSGCGGGKKSESGSLSGTAGAKVFASAGCGNCHTLSEADAKGNVGPNLDQLKPEKELVARQVRNGGVGMPSFSDKLSAGEIDQVAVFVADATRKATGGGSVAAGYEPDDTTLEDCQEGDNHCYEQAFANISYKQSPKEALDLFDERIKTPARSKRTATESCTQSAEPRSSTTTATSARHSLQAGRAVPRATTTASSNGPSSASSRASSGAAANKFCSGDMVRKTEFIAYQCVHGLGHGLMIYTGYDLPLSLRTCDKLTSGWDATSCTGGVFMENYQSSYGVQSKWLRNKDLLYPCDAVAERYKYYCYDLVTARILPKVNYNWTKAAKVCRTSEKGWVEHLLPVTRA